MSPPHKQLYLVEFINGKSNAEKSWPDHMHGNAFDGNKKTRWVNEGELPVAIWFHFDTPKRIIEAGFSYPEALFSTLAHAPMKIGLFQ